MKESADRKVTHLPAVPVKYGWRTPSMSRRGGVRLRITDGIVPYGEQLCHIRTRDKAGNRLVDVTDPMTGFCIGATSALESRPSNDLRVKPGVSGAHNTATRDGSAVRVDTDKGVMYHEPWEGDMAQARVFRTTDMGDDPLPLARVRKPASERKKGRTMKRDGRAGDTPAANQAPLPGGTGKNGRITDADCRSYIKALARDRNIEVTPAMIKDARLAIKAAQRKMMQAGR